MRKYLSLCLCIALVFTSVCAVNAEAIKYLPDVTKEMSQPEYWTDGEDVLMTMDEIELQNSRTISTKATCMYDLKNRRFDATALHQAGIDAAILPEVAGNPFLGCGKLGIPVYAAAIP